MPAGGNQLCLSRVVFLHNRQTGQLVRQQIVRVHIDAATRNVNSAHPANVSANVAEPRDHAWQLWCRTVAILLSRSSGKRLALVASPDGDVLLRPDEDGPPPLWSAEPGT